jgi:hypothetical protein
MHRIHIEDDIWKWYFGKRSNIIVFAPTGKRYEVPLKDFIKNTDESAEKYVGKYVYEAGIEAMIDDRAYTITPAGVKDFILKTLKGQDQSWALCRR